MQTVEVTRHRATGPQQSTLKLAYNILKDEGIMGINKGVNAVALRQMTNWGSRLGISRLVEQIFQAFRPEEQKGTKLSVSERLAASVVGGTLGETN
jgi:hypothetical protein